MVIKYSIYTLYGHKVRYIYTLYGIIERTWRVDRIAEFIFYHALLYSKKGEEGEGVLC